jgi:DNA-binding transcriptional LysR family regulator
MYTSIELQLFVLTAQRGNLSQAAREFDMQAATASAAIKRLEQQLACRLFERTTRSMRLTLQGELFFDHCRTALAALAQGEAAILASSAALHGQLRLSAPADFGRNVLVPILNQFQRSHPGIVLTLHCTDQHSDLVRDPVDMAFRYGRLADSSLVAQTLAENRRVVVAAPSYLAEHGVPANPAALAGHNCLLHNLNRRLSNTWRFRGTKGPVEVDVHGDRVSDDGGIVRDWAVAGCGIAYKSAIDVRADLAAGRLVALLSQLEGEDWPLSVVYPHRSSLSPLGHAVLAEVKAALAAPATA